MKRISAPLWGKGLLLRGVLLKGLLVLGLCPASTAYAATFTVSNTNDSSAGSLRQAITSANATAGVDTIAFNIAGTGVKTINLASDLPIIEEHLIIDGTTQPGFSGAPLIELNGSGVESGGIYFAVSNPDAPGSSAVKSLIINRFPSDGITIFQTNRVTITGCYIGTDATGTMFSGNDFNGILISGSSNCVIGGANVASRNLISGNGADGVLIDSVPDFGPVSTNNVVQGNYIGTDITGVQSIGNAFDGVHIENSNNNIVGGLATSQANRIAYSGFSGVYVPLSMGVTTSTGNAILRNQIFGNYMLGIDLADAAEHNTDYGIITANDNGDTDSGANNNQNYPVLSSISTTNGNTTLSGTLNSLPNRTYVLDFYRNSELHVNGYTETMVAEGENYFATATVTTDATGNASFSIGLGAGAGGQYITATATQTTSGPGFNDTSEFSAPRLVPVAPKSIQFSAATYTVYEASGPATITVTRSGDASAAATVNYATADDTATAGSDYTGASGTLNFAAGQTSQTFSIPITDNHTNEANETITLTLSNATGGSLGTPSTAILTIVDNDAAPALRINDTSVTESAAGSSAVFTVTLSAASGQMVTVDYATATGGFYSATADSDYIHTTGTLIFTAGQTERTITVPILDDSSTENRETFFVNLSNAVNATIADPQAIGTIIDDEVPLSLAINHATITEGHVGTVNATFIVTLSKAATETVTVNYATGNNTAVQPADYMAQSGTLSFAPGQTSKTITVVIQGDTLDEADERFLVTLSNAQGAPITVSQGIGTITDDDRASSASINDVTVTEGNSTTVNATFTVTLSAPSGQTVAISAIPSDGSARAPGDYTSGGFRLTFAPGEVTKTVSVPVKGDLLDEVNEVFYVLLSSPTNVVVGRGRGVGTITDDDAAPTISVDDISVKEYNAGQTTAAVRLRLSAPSGQIVRVSYATANGTALAGSDYVAVAPTVVSFTTGNLYAYARVLINGDVLNEPNETFLVNLSSPQNATIADGQAVGTILNDDAAPALSINDVSIAEGNSGTKLLTFTVSLSAASGQNVSVNFATANGTAIAGTDYVAQSGTLTFAPGSALTRTVSVVINGDAVVEGNETLLVLLSGATNASISKARGVGTITNDDTSG